MGRRGRWREGGSADVRPLVHGAAAWRGRQGLPGRTEPGFAEGGDGVRRAFTGEGARRREVPVRAARVLRGGPEGP